MASVHLLIAQDIFQPSENKLNVAATRISDNLLIDGVLNERHWVLADTIGNFIQIEPHQREPSRFNTQVMVLYNREYLYVGAICYEVDGKKSIRVPDLNRDFSFRQNDTFAVGIDGFSDERNTVTLATNPYGTQKDYLSFDDLLFDSDWNGLWKVRTSIEGDRWTAEFAIPWKSLRYPIDLSTDTPKNWGINFVRQRRASNEISAWSPYPRSFGFNRAEYFGELSGIEPPKPSSNLQVNPYTLVSNTDTDGIEGLEDAGASVKVGGEVKWALSPHTVLDITYNTDFAQAEADQQVNNITRFSVLFPERRQFFLENASLFGAGLDGATGFTGNMSIIPFFSRQVGLTPSGSPIPLDGGIRLVHRDVKKSYGVMAVKQAAEGTIPTTYAAVGRYSKNMGKTNRLGAIYTTKLNHELVNTVGGIDGLFRLSNEQYINFMLLQSHTSTDNQLGLGGYVQYLFTNNFMNAWITQTYLGQEFDPQLGFISRQNVTSSSTGAIANLRGKPIPMPNLIRAYTPKILADVYYEASSGQLLERNITVSPFWLEFQQGGFINFQTTFQLQNLKQTFAPLGQEISIGDYHFTRFALGAGTDPSDKVSVTLGYDFGDYFDGSLQHLNASLSLIPIPHISLSGSIDHNKFESVGEETTKSDVQLYTFNSRFFLNPRVQFTALYQHNTLDQSDIYNFRFAWEYHPLSFLYLIYTTNEANGLERNLMTRQEQSIVKISFLKQF